MHQWLHQVPEFEYLVTLIEQRFKEMTFLSLCRLSRQVYDLKTSVKEIASRLDLIMTRLHLHDEIKAREATKQLAATKNVCMEYVVSMNPILTVFWPINNRIPVHLHLLCLPWNWQCFLLGRFSLESWIFLWWGRPGCCGRQQGQGAVEYILSRQLLTPLLYVKNTYIGFSQN